MPDRCGAFAERDEIDGDFRVINSRCEVQALRVARCPLFNVESMLIPTLCHIDFSFVP